MSTAHVNVSQPGSQRSTTSPLSPITDSQQSTTHSQLSTTHSLPSAPSTAHPQPLAFGLQMAFADLPPTATDPQLSGDPQLRIDLPVADPPIARIDSMLVPDSQTVADAPSHPNIGQDPPASSGEVATDQSSRAVDPQPIIIDEDTQMIYNNVMLIPDTISAQIPSPKDVISSLLHRSPFNPTFTSLTKPLPVPCLLDDSVQWTVDGILNMPIPPQQWTSDLELVIKAQLHTGARPNSVQHPTISSLCLPLWVVEFWKSILSAHSQMEVWKEAATWLLGEAARGEDVSGAEELFRRVPWGTKLWMLTESDTLIGLLAELLSTEWLRERHLDLFSIYLTSRVGEGADEWFVGGIYVTEMLKRINPKTALPEIGALAELSKQLIQGKYKKVLLPANINDNHWILVLINLDKRTIVYGA